MASSLLVLLDDIASVLDDVATLAKVATKKTAGVLGDDLALNAQQVSGVTADRELPVVWAVAKGSLRNKAILVPAALAISAFAPWAVTPLLMAGGLFLSFEGFEKLAHAFVRGRDHGGGEPRGGQPHGSEEGRQVAERANPDVAPAQAPFDLAAFEKRRIGGAVRTDFILSAEIIVITLGTVAAASLGTRVVVLAGIALLMTVGVYGLVAAIVKLDDAGLHLARRQGATIGARLLRGAGGAIVDAAPWMMKALSVAGTAAMFLVGGGILAHGIPGLHGWIDAIVQGTARPGSGGGFAGSALALAIDAITGIVAGAIAVFGVSLARRARGARPMS
ncbi:MAG: DUF808 domain-containing protein [Burkholderiaceae bacterium]|nr:DUF808 domain-containing protein [Burkholderiaceae bacterium]